MKSKGGLALLLVLLLSALVATPARAAPTRQEYVAQVDPLCQAAIPQLVATNDAFIKTLKAINRRLKHGRIKGILRLISSAARSLNTYTAAHASLTTQISGVQPPQGDEFAVNTWIEGRRHAEAFGNAAASSLKQVKFRQFQRQFDQAVAADQSAIGPVSSFGFQQCI